ncbi:DUF6907 domain-containing protein [Streptomyces fenghuangensis]
MAVSVSTAPAEQPDDSAPIPFSLTPAAEALAQQGRMVPARIAGNLVAIPCPPWCTVDHVEQDARFAEDIYHASPRISLSAPSMTGTTEIVEAWVSQYPFSRSGDTAPYLAFDAAGTGEVAELGRDAALAFADQFEAHARRLRDMTASLPDDERPTLPRRRPGASNPPAPRA